MVSTGMGIVVPARAPRGDRAVTVRVALAEDDVLVRQGMEGVLASADDLTLVASAGDLDAAMQAIESSKPGRCGDRHQDASDHDGRRHSTRG